MGIGLSWKIGNASCLESHISLRHCLKAVLGHAKPQVSGKLCCLLWKEGAFTVVPILPCTTAKDFRVAA